MGDRRNDWGIGKLSRSHTSICRLGILWLNYQALRGFFALWQSLNVLLNEGLGSKHYLKSDSNRRRGGDNTGVKETGEK